MEAELLASKDKEIEALKAALASRDRELEALRGSDADRVVDSLAARRTVRRFTDAPVPAEHIQRAVATGQRASTSSWIQAFALLQISEPALLAPGGEVISTSHAPHNMIVYRESLWKLYTGLTGHLGVNDFSAPPG